MPSKSSSSEAEFLRNQAILSGQIADAAEPLPALEDANFARAFDRFADRKVVCLGESTHGSHEFYKARAAITKHFIQNYGFSFVAVEADWPDAAAVNRYIRHWPGIKKTRPYFQRFPTWMWRNTEVADLVHWLHDYNIGPSRRAGFFGLDMYSMKASIDEVVRYLQKVDPQAAEIARHRYGCLTPWEEEPANYGRAVLLGYKTCEKGIVKQCEELLGKELDYSLQNGEEFFDAAQNARVVASAERYYRIMYHGGPESWNLRDAHMFETLQHLLTTHGPEAKAIVWAHNSHIGDARFTDMGMKREELSLGQLCRQYYGDKAALIGFGTHTGTVAAADEWDGVMKVKPVNPSLNYSIERMCHETGLPSFLLDLRLERHPQLKEYLMEPWLERFIGVIYKPATELWSHYSKCLLAGQFDAYVWFDETKAVTPLGDQHAKKGAPETYPFGL